MDGCVVVAHVSSAIVSLHAKKKTTTSTSNESADDRKTAIVCIICVISEIHSDLFFISTSRLYHSFFLWYHSFISLSRLVSRLCQFVSWICFQFALFKKLCRVKVRLSEFAVQRERVQRAHTQPYLLYFAIFSSFLFLLLDCGSTMNNKVSNCILLFWSSFQLSDWSTGQRHSTRNFHSPKRNRRRRRKLI